MVSNALWRGMQASARTLPRTCARSPVLASSGRRVYMCPGAVCAARVCEKRAIFELTSNALWRSMQTSARTLPRTCARSPVLASSGRRVYMCPGAVCASRVCAPLCGAWCGSARTLARTCALALSHVCFVTPHAGARLYKVTCAPTHMLAPCFHACACVLGRSYVATPFAGTIFQSTSARCWSTPPRRAPLGCAERWCVRALCARRVLPLWTAPHVGAVHTCALLCLRVSTALGRGV